MAGETHDARRWEGDGAPFGPARALEAIVRLNHVASRDGSDEALFHEALEAVERLLSPSRAAVLVKDEAEVMRFVAHRRLSEAFRAEVEGHSPWGPEEACPLAVLVPDVREDRGLARFHPLLEREGLRAMAFIPMVADGALLGKLTLCYDAPHPFADAEVELAQVVASHLAFVVARRKVEAQLGRDMAVTRRAERRLRLLAEAGEVLLDDASPERALSFIAERAVKTLADVCLVDLEREGGGGSVRVALAAADDALQPVLEGLRAYAPGPDTRQPAGVALRTGRPVFLPVLEEADWVQLGRDARHLELVRRLAPVSGVSVPLLRAGTAFGAMSFFSTRSGPTHGRRYDEGDVACFQDLAHRVSVALENVRLKNELGEAVRARDEFLSIASHELRTPLTALMLQLDALLRPRHAAEVLEPARGKLEGAARQVRRVNRLVEELLEVSRISAGRMQLERERLDLAALVGEVARRMEPELSRAGCPLQLDAEGPAVAFADRLRMELLVGNLISNAAKYGAGTQVTVSVRAEGEGIRLVVKDEGIGIAPEHLDRIFGRFERMVSTRNFGGFGLGLWIVRQVADAHGGTVRASSALGEGARFEVELPRAPVSPG